jgi:hypothetical protein
MKDLSNILIEQSFTIVNWLTTFIIIQSLGFCYALGKEARFAEILEQKAISLMTIAGMLIVLVACLTVVYLIFQNLISLADTEVKENLHSSLILQMWVRIGGITVYGIFPIALILYTKILN